MKVNEYIHRPARYRVAAPALVAELNGGGQEHVYRGQFLPASTRRSQIEHLLETGFIKEMESSK